MDQKTDGHKTGHKTDFIKLLTIGLLGFLVGVAYLERALLKLSLGDPPPFPLVAQHNLQQMYGTISF